jgi:hypothetical protein
VQKVPFPCILEKSLFNQNCLSRHVILDDAEKIRSSFEFFSQKIEKTKNYETRKKFILQASSGNVYLVEKPSQSEFYRSPLEKCSLHSDFFRENQVKQKIRSEHKYQRKLEYQFYSTAKKYKFQASYENLYSIKYDSSDVLFKMPSEKNIVCMYFFVKSKKT